MTAKILLVHFYVKTWHVMMGICALSPWIHWPSFKFWKKKSCNDQGSWRLNLEEPLEWDLPRWPTTTWHIWSQVADRYWTGTPLWCGVFFTALSTVLRINWWLFATHSTINLGHMTWTVLVPPQGHKHFQIQDFCIVWAYFVEFNYSKIRFSMQPRMEAFCRIWSWVYFK